jgi:hypothetical protein
VTHLANAVIGFFTTDIRWECHCPETTVGGVYDAFYEHVIRTTLAFRRFLPSRVMTDTTPLNMVIFGDSKGPRKGGDEQN